MANTPLIRIKRVPGAQCGGVVHDAYFIVKVRVSHDETAVKLLGIGMFAFFVCAAQALGLGRRGHT